MVDRSLRGVGLDPGFGQVRPSRGLGEAWFFMVTVGLGRARRQRPSLSWPGEEVAGWSAQEALGGGRAIGARGEVVVYDSESRQLLGVEAAHGVLEMAEAAVAPFDTGSGSLEDVRAFLTWRSQNQGGGFAPCTPATTTQESRKRGRKERAPRLLWFR